MHYIEMDVRLFIITTVLMSVCFVGEAGVAFNFNEKLESTSTTDTTQSAQLIRVRELDCPFGHRRDAIGICRQSLPGVLYHWQQN